LFFEDHHTRGHGFVRIETRTVTQAQALAIATALAAFLHPVSRALVQGAASLRK
jgi:hypothetical protein